jgi:hypothetical protein
LGGRRLAIGKTAFLELLAAPAGTWIVTPDVTPGVPDRLVRVREIAPRGFLAVLVEDVFGAARPIQRYQHVLDVTELILRESIDVVGRAFGCRNVVIELATIGPFLGYAAFAKGIVGERHQVAQAEQGDGRYPACRGPIRQRRPAASVSVATA